MRKYIALLLVLLLVSCSWPFSKKTAEKTSKPTKKAEQAVKGERVESGEAKPGDIKVIDGVEYIYAKNRKFMVDAAEPEYVWIRKDQYTPTWGEVLGQRLAGGLSPEEQRTRDEMEDRISKLEEELKKKGLQPQMVYPSQFAYLPTGTGVFPGATMVPFNYPSPKMRRRVVVLPIVDQTNFKDENLGDLATKRLVTRLENSAAIVVVSPDTLNQKGSLVDSGAMKVLDQVYGIQAVITGTLSDVYTSSSKVEGKNDKETSFAMAKISLSVYNTETGALLKQLTGRNPVYLSREIGDMSSEKAKIKAMDLSIEVIADDLLKSVLYLDWHARVASIENGKVYVNAGRLSGLEKGSTLEVYAPGEQIVDVRTKAPLGNVKGSFKGQLEVVEVFGVDASSAKIVSGGNFSSSDLVYFKQ